MWKKFKAFFLPISLIAQELSTIRELYEAELASRTPPILRITESPSKSDTEVTYAGDEPKKSMKDKLAELMGEVDEEEEE